MCLAEEVNDNLNTVQLIKGWSKNDDETVRKAILVLSLIEVSGNVLAQRSQLFFEILHRYGVTLSSSGSQQGSMMCRIKSQFVGNQNLSFIVSGTHGSSYPYKAIRHVSADNRIYMFQTYAGQPRYR